MHHERQVNHALKTGHASSSQAPVLQEFHIPKLSLISWHQQGSALRPDHTACGHIGDINTVPWSSSGESKWLIIKTSSMRWKSGKWLSSSSLWCHVQCVKQTQLICSPLCQILFLPCGSGYDLNYPAVAGGHQNLTKGFSGLGDLPKPADPWIWSLVSPAGSITYSHVL